MSIKNKNSEKGPAFLIVQALYCSLKFGAGDEIRTHDFNLGKVALYP